MSRLYEAMRRMELERNGPSLAAPEPVIPSEPLKGTLAAPVDLNDTRSIQVDAREGSRLVALTDPRSLAAEKFRGLATRLENLRRERELRSIQVTSSMINEGKSLVSVNLAFTLALECSARVLLVEGDLHRPSLPARLGLSELTGIGQWWNTRDQDITKFIYRLNQWPLWFLSAGGCSEQPSHILKSRLFGETFLSLHGRFDWIIVDSTPMLPTVDANLWSRLVDGTLLVVREGVAYVKALKRGLQALDHPKLVGVVFNEASEFDRENYEGQYYALRETDTESATQ